jgi:dipeptidyl aminopeptidase/acylaminoacyl peptidase
MADSIAYGSWSSPITADLIVAGSVGLGGVALDGTDIYWLESRPSEAGRSVLVRQTGPDNTGATGQLDVVPAGFSVRSRVHEYGGGAFTIDAGVIYASRDDDQRLYAIAPAQLPKPLTPEMPLRYADGVIDRQRSRWIGICEDHRQSGEPVNTICFIPLDGSLADSSPETLSATLSASILVSGDDFYAAPRLSPDGQWLAWFSWNHPHMPWDVTTLWVAPIEANGAIGPKRAVAGGQAESVIEPVWSPSGLLYFVSDRSDWWNLYCCDPADSETEPKAICPMAAEFGLPHWVFSTPTYGFVTGSNGTEILCAYSQSGIWSLGRIDGSGTLSTVPSPYSEIGDLVIEGDRALFIGGSAALPTAIVEWTWAAGVDRFKPLKVASDNPVDRGYLSTPEPIAFSSGSGQAYGIYYPPTNCDCQAPSGEKPPLLVKSHGGPTAAARSSLNLTIQYWTSRGIAVLDVNYSGSTGYGRAYRDRLQGNWGITDVEDCINGAKYLVDRGDVDGDRLTIDGGSAGGYTTLCALTFHRVFKAGASRYGVSDLRALAQDTHKFEARYLDSLVGPYPAEADRYRERSPIHHVDRLACPVIFFQGLEDKVVPPNQTEAMVEALRAKGLPVAYVAFPGEQHGFRQAQNIKRALDGELSFYSQIFGFELADPIEPVAIDNLTAATNLPSP